MNIYNKIKLSKFITLFFKNKCQIQGSEVRNAQLEIEDLVHAFESLFCNSLLLNLSLKLSHKANAFLIGLQSHVCVMTS
jgi:hypothetical protein